MPPTSDGTLRASVAEPAKQQAESAVISTPAHSEPSGSNEVFINCPFDPAYLPMFDAIVFGLMVCGFTPICALESANAAEVRIEKLIRIIRRCRLAVHDLSRVELSELSKLPRFNMPLELGLWLGARHFGVGVQKKKSCLIFDSEAYRYQRFISDIAGQDPKPHQNDPQLVVRAIRDWLVTNFPQLSLPGGVALANRFSRFLEARAVLASDAELTLVELTFVDRVKLVRRWLDLQQQPVTS